MVYYFEIEDGYFYGFLNLLNLNVKIVEYFCGDRVGNFINESCVIDEVDLGWCERFLRECFFVS